MSYSNNWLKKISETYKSKKSNIDYVKEDTETLLAIIKMLCEKLNIDVEELLSEATKKDPYEGPFEGVTPQSGDNAPHGWKKIRQGNRWVRKPITDAEAKAEAAAFNKKNPNHWEEGERIQTENPLNPDNDDQITGPDDHLPKVGAQARAERSAAIQQHRAGGGVFGGDREMRARASGRSRRSR